MARSCLGRLEGDDAGDRDVEPEVERAPRDLRARAEAVQQAGEGALAVLLLEDVAGLGVGVARVHDQRQAGFARRRDVGTEALAPARRAGCARRRNRARSRRCRPPWDAAPPRSGGRGRAGPPPWPRADGRRPSTRCSDGARRWRARGRTGRAACRWSACPRRRPTARAPARPPRPWRARESRDGSDCRSACQLAAFAAST